MGAFLQDVRYGWKLLGKNPGFTAAAVVVLALGIGANTTIFTFINAVRFSPLPFKNADRVVYVLEGKERLYNWGAVSAADFADWKSQNRVFEEMALFLPDAVNLAGRGEPERVSAIRLSPEIIPLLSVNPDRGRLFAADDFSSATNPAAVISHALWMRRFGAGSGPVGESVVIDGQPHTIIGVLPESARFALVMGVEPDVLLPIPPTAVESRDARRFVALARLKPEITLERARSDMEAIAHRLQQQYPETNARWTVWIDTLRGTVDPAAYALIGLLIAAVLGIACTNVINLLLARSAGREREMSIRTALGASRARIVVQLMTENLLLTLLGSIAGTAFSYWACHAVSAYTAGSNAGNLDLRMDYRVLGATLLMFLLTGAVVGLLPALQIVRTDLNRPLKEGGPGSHSSPSKRRLRNALIASEIALSMILLTGAGLTIRSWIRLWQIDPGYRTEGLLTTNVSLASAEYPQAQQQTAFFGRLLDGLGNRAGIESAAVTTALPTAGPGKSFTIDGQDAPAEGEIPVARFAATSPSYMATMGISLKSGRFFTPADTDNAAPVAIISETMARRYWQTGNSLGSRIRFDGEARTIVGIVGDMRSAPLHLRPYPEVYVPYAQDPGPQVALVVRTGPGNAAAALDAIKREIRALNPGQPAGNLRTMEEVISTNMGVIRLGASLLALIAAGATILTAIGLYGVLAFTVLQRTSEIGVRIAIGARPADVLRLILGQGLRLVLLGALPGLAVSLALGKVLSNRIHGVNAVEPGVLAAVAGLLLIVTLGACYFPARRATRVDPIRALRLE